jgi:hypothetical protein
MLRTLACLAAVTAGLLWVAPAATAHAERNTLGPHFGWNFDADDPLIGIEGRFDVANLGSSAILQLNPSFSYYFTHSHTFNLSFNVPFEFLISGSVVRPFAAPGLAIFHWSGGGDTTDVKLNLIGGVLFHLESVEPFVEIRLAVGDGDTADLIGGVLFRL